MFEMARSLTVSLEQLYQFCIITFQVCKIRLNTVLCVMYIYIYIYTHTHTHTHIYKVRDSSVDIVTRLQSTFVLPKTSKPAFQTSKPPIPKLKLGLFRGQCGRDIKVTTHLHVVSRLGMSLDVFLLDQHAFMTIKISTVYVFPWCTRWRSWLRHFATSWEVTGSIPDGVIEMFH